MPKFKFGRYFLLILMWLQPGLFTLAQPLAPTFYPRGFFRNPLNIPISLSGNFGELRPNHYHMGLDLKTLKKENLPVYAAAEGYIARIKIEPGGFGRAIYINHPNGFTTLYAHLNEFFPALESYVKQQQYKQQTWSVFLDLSPELFPVHKGAMIAYSGSTGGSQAPHVHFEIRRTKDDVNLNPLLFGFPLDDNTKPVILRLAVYDRNKSTYEQYPKIIALKRSATGFITAAPGPIAVATDKVSFAISGYDTHSGSANQNGIYRAWLYDNGEPVCGFTMDKISYNDTRYLNAHIDYKTRAMGGPYLQHVSELPGYLNSIYTKSTGNGVIDLSDTAEHAIRIDVQDAYGNSSELNCSVRYNGYSATAMPQAEKIFYPLMLDVFESEDCEFYLGENCLYDSVSIRHTRAISSNALAVSAVHTIGPSYIPLHDAFVVRLKPSRDLTEAQSRAVLMQRFDARNKEVQKVQWENGWASARFREMGNFQLLVDEEPPMIVPVGFADGANLSKASRIVFIIRDNMEKFRKFRAELDGKWLRFTNDKGRSFIYRFDEMCPPGEHELKISVEDEAGNVAVKVYSFRR